MISLATAAPRRETAVRPTEGYFGPGPGNDREGARTMTSSDQNSRDPRRDEVIAGEYVLGVLSAEERRKVEDRLRRDRAFAAVVNRWEENLLTINEELGMSAPGAQAYVSSGRSGPRTPVDGADPRGLRKTLAFWRSIALAALAALVLVAASDLFTTPPAGRAPIAELAGDDSPINLVAYYDPTGGVLSLSPAPTRRDRAKSLQLWLVEDGVPPISLGVLPASGEGTVVIPDNRRARLARGATLAISVEPPGGSPTGSQTGPVIAAGESRPF